MSLNDAIPSTHDDDFQRWLKHEYKPLRGAWQY